MHCGDRRMTPANELTIRLDPPRHIVKDSRLAEAFMTEQSDILFDVRDGVGRVTFNRPQARNAFTFQMYERLAEICEEANKDRAIKVLIFTGAGDKAFASGTDINQFRAFKTPEDAIEYEARNDRVLGVLERCRVPTIAAIAGVCTGGGAAHRGLL